MSQADGQQSRNAPHDDQQINPGDAPNAVSHIHPEVIERQGQENE